VLAVALVGFVFATFIFDRGNASIANRTSGASTTGESAAWDAMGFSDDTGSFSTSTTTLAGTNKDVFALDATATVAGQTASYVRTLTSSQVQYTIKQLILGNGGAGVFNKCVAGIDSLNILHQGWTAKFTLQVTHSN
jgi:hypothetical protein